MPRGSSSPSPRSRSSQRERRLRRARRRTNRAKDEFLSLVSHELRSPLNAILGWNRILAVKRGDDAEVAAVTPRIERSAKAQLKLVNDLLDLGRIGTGKLRITPRTIRALRNRRRCRGCDASRGGGQADRSAHAVQQRQRGSERRSRPPAAGDCQSALQRHEIHAGGGRIDVRVGASDGIVRAQRRGHGAGHRTRSAALRVRPLPSGRRTRTQRTGGLGLGLTLVREIIALHGGTVAASSEGQGQGASFRVRLPGASQAAETAARESHGDGTNGSAKRALDGLSILVVDDEMDARTVVAETLRMEGARVTVSDSARRSAGSAARSGARFDVIVTDIGMPEEDGYSLVRKLRALSNGERMVASRVTGFASRNDVEAAIDAGFDLHVPKPVDFDSFVPIIRRLSLAR